MARKSARDRNQKPPQIGRKQPELFSGRLSWLAAFLLLISVAESGPFQSVRILPAPADSVLTPEWAWQPAIQSLDALKPLSECPYWLYAAVVSFLICSFLQSCFGSLADEKSGPGIELLVLAALSRPLVIVDLITVASFFAAGWLLKRPPPSGKFRTVSAMFAMTATGAVVCCVDFGLVLIVLLAGWMKYSRQILAGRQMVSVIAGMLVILSGCMVWLPGFAQAFTRPLTWYGVSNDFISMSPLLNGDLDSWLSLILSGSVVVHSWSLAWKSNRRDVSQILFLSFFTVLTLNCQYYHWLGLLGVVSFSDYANSMRRFVLPRRLLACGFVLIVLLSFGTQFEHYRSFVLTGRWPQQFVDPAEWNTSGCVMLMQPAHSCRWQTERLRKEFRLLVDDRWDLFSDQYQNYRLVCRDLSEFRSSRYLLSDGSWGGYKQWTNEWKPALLVADSSDLDGIRRLSASPDWNVVGIDSHRTIFAAANEPQNAQQMRVAGRLLSELEWPTSQFDGSYGNVIAASGASASMKVAQVLLAIRLPYAALRVMPESDSQSRVLTALSYFEISHRVFRHTQTHSLLDQYRAVSQLRKFADDRDLSSRLLIRIARGLETLGEYGTAIEFAEHILEQYGNAGLPEEHWATDLIARCRPQLTDRAETADPEQAIRQAFLAGDRSEVELCLTTISDDARAFFEALSDADTKTPEDVYFELIDLLNAGNVPARLRGEALFYLGSLAIEAGDSVSAITAFSASIQAAPALPLNPISRISLQNLQKAAR